ncbi:retropepsin-like aspartic protease family protein [Roseibium sp. M-1]
MSRFIVVLVALMIVGPLVPLIVERGRGLSDGGAELEVARSETDAETGKRTYRVARNRQGHFVADAYLNGRSVDMLVDTGATVTALPESLAEDIGIFLKPADYKYPIQTANGTVYGARADIDDLRLGSIRLRNVDALVLKDQSLSEPLLGMSALNQLQRFDISGSTLVLVQ